MTNTGAGGQIEGRRRWRLHAGSGRQQVCSRAVWVEVLAENIYFNKKNSTRFIIVTNPENFPEGREQDQYLFRDTAFERFSV